MAVAVKHSSDTSTGSPFDRMPVVSLVGLVYILGSLAIVFKLIPFLWDQLCRGIGVAADSPGSLMLMGVVMLGAATGLIVLGSRLLGPRPMPGVKAGIFVALVGFLFVLLVTRWFSLWVEHFVYDERWFGSNGPTIGIVLVAVFFGGLLFLGARWFNGPGFERSMIGFEHQGWFTAAAYKKQQGLKVRRGTILGILLLVGAGIYTMISHRTLDRGPANWDLNIPFTGKVTLTKDTMGDAAPYLLPEVKNLVGELQRLAGDNRIPEPDVSDRAAVEKYAELVERATGKPFQLVIDRYTLRAINDHVDPAKYVKIDVTGRGDVPEEIKELLENGPIVPRAEYEQVEKKIATAKGYEYSREFRGYVRKGPEIVGENEKPRDVIEDNGKRFAVERWKGYAIPPTPATGQVVFATIPILPAVKFTLPLLLLALALWFAWRMVNVPTFADFLIATEAELNKVSWTTRRRLYQDTIVVLVTVIMMAVYLFAMDQLWGTLLSWKPIGVIVISKTEAKGTEQKPW